MSAHTEGPLTKITSSGYRFAVGNESKTVANCYDQADARRLAACWNALSIFQTEQIESGIDLVALVQERDKLAADLAEACARNNELIEHQAAKAIELAEERGERAMVRAELARTHRIVDAAYEVLAEVLANNQAQAAAYELGDCTEAPDLDMAERIRALLKGEPAPTPTVDHAAVASAKAIIEHAARDLLKDVADLGMVLTISQRSLHPPAMGNYETIVEVRESRATYQAREAAERAEAAEAALLRGAA